MMKKESTLRPYVKFLIDIKLTWLFLFFYFFIAFIALIGTLLDCWKTIVIETFKDNRHYKELKKNV